MPSSQQRQFWSETQIAPDKRLESGISIFYDILEGIGKMIKAK